MQSRSRFPSRRSLLQIAGATVAGSVLGVGDAPAATSGTSVFDGKTLDGWIQIENSATSLPSGSITDPAAFAARLANGSDAVSAFLRGRLTDAVKADLAAFSAAGPNAKTVVSALAKELNQVIAGPSIYDQARFVGVVLRPDDEVDQSEQHTGDGYETEDDACPAWPAVAHKALDGGRKQCGDEYRHQHRDHDFVEDADEIDHECSERGDHEQPPCPLRC